MALPAPELGSQDLAALAYGGTGGNAHWFAVWQEITPTSYVIRGARFDANGTVVDAPALVIATLSRNSAPSVAYDGTNFVVAWADGSVTSQEFFTTVNPATGAVATPTQLTNSGENKFDPVVAGGGNTALVCWSESTGTTIRCTYLAAGVVSSTVNNTKVSANTVVAGYPSVTWGGGSANNFLVLYEENLSFVNANVRGAIVDASGVQAQQVISTGPAPVGDPTAASNGSMYVAYWSDTRAASGNAEIWQRSISFDGMTLGTE